MINTAGKFLLMEKLDVLNALSDHQKKLLSENCILKTYKKDEKIYHTGSDIRYVFVVEKGAVFIGRNTSAEKPILKDIVYEDSIFGENIFTKQPSRNDFAKAVRDSRIFLIPVNLFEKLFKENRAFSFQVTSLMISRLQNLESRIQNFVFLKAKERIGAFLFKSAQKQGIKIGIEEILINLGLSHKELAYITDTSRQTVARVLGDFKKDNIIHFSERKPGKILIRNIDALAY